MAPGKLTDPEGLAAPFIEEWHNGLPYVTAHTSGSTGTPKEVRLLKADMEASARATCRFFGIDSSSTLHLPLSAGYIAGKMMIVRAMTSGARLVVEAPSLEPLSGFTGHADLTAIVPAQTEALVRGLAYCTISNVIVGGAPLGASQEALLRDAQVRAYATYGMTETCSHVALRCISGGERHFTALPGMTFSQDGRGCLVIESATMSFGRLVTNDVVELLDARRFVWRGRADNVINTGGIKVVPEEIEEKLAPLMEGRAFYVGSRPSARWGSELVLVTERGDGMPATEMILAEATRVLPRRLVPKAVVVKDMLKRTETGKIKRE